MARIAEAVARTIAFAGVVLLAACGSSKPLHMPASLDLDFTGAFACSSHILSGRVVEAVDGEAGRTITTMDVDDWIKPEVGPRRVSLDTVDIAKEGVYPRWLTGQHLNLVIDVDPAALPNSVTAANLELYRAARSAAVGIECPYGPS